MADAPAAGATPEDAAASSDLGRLLWEAAAGLSDRDRTILELHLKQGLEGEELSRALGVSTQHGYVLVARLREQIERSLGALLVARLGRRDCPELAEILRRWDGRLSPLLRKRVARHADQCEVCGRRSRALVSPGALLAALPLLPVPTRIREHVLGNVELVSHRSDDHQPPWDDDGFPPGEDGSTGRRRPGRSPRLAAAVLVVLALLGAALVADRPETVVTAGGGGPSSSTTTVEGTPTSSGPITLPPATTTSPPTPSTTAGSPPQETVPGPVPPGPPGSPAALALTADRLDFSAVATRLSVGLQNRGGHAADWLATGLPAWLGLSPAGGRLEPGGVAAITVDLLRERAPEGDLSVAIRFEWAGGTDTLTVAGRVERAPVVSDVHSSETSLWSDGCTPDRTTVSATIADDAGLKRVELRWEISTGAKGTKPMTAGTDGRWSAPLGVFSSPGGKVSYVVDAEDVRGNVASSMVQSFAVNDCGPP